MSVKTLVSIFLFLSIAVLEVAPTLVDVHSYAIEETAEKSSKEGSEKETNEIEDEFKKFYQNFISDSNSKDQLSPFSLNDRIKDTRNPFIDINTPPPELA